MENNKIPKQNNKRPSHERNIFISYIETLPSVLGGFCYQLKSAFLNTGASDTSAKATSANEFASASAWELVPRISSAWECWWCCKSRYLSGPLHHHSYTLRESPSFGSTVTRGTPWNPEASEREASSLHSVFAEEGVKMHCNPDVYAICTLYIL